MSFRRNLFIEDFLWRPWLFNKIREHPPLETPSPSIADTYWKPLSLAEHPWILMVESFQSMSVWAPKKHNTSISEFTFEQKSKRVWWVFGKTCLLKIYMKTKSFQQNPRASTVIDAVSINSWHMSKISSNSWGSTDTDGGTVSVHQYMSPKKARRISMWCGRPKKACHTKRSPQVKKTMNFRSDFECKLQIKIILIQQVLHHRSLARRSTSTSGSSEVAPSIAGYPWILMKKSLRPIGGKNPKRRNASVCPLAQPVDLAKSYCHRQLAWSSYRWWQHDWTICNWIKTGPTSSVYAPEFFHGWRN